MRSYAIAYAVRIQVGEDGLDEYMSEHLTPHPDGSLWVGPFDDEFDAIAFATNPENIAALNAVDVTVTPFEKPLPKSTWDAIA